MTAVNHAPDGRPRTVFHVRTTDDGCAIQRVLDPFIVRDIVPEKLHATRDEIGAALSLSIEIEEKAIDEAEKLAAIIRAQTCVITVLVESLAQEAAAAA